ncbi:unnamed protein product [Protopolystoma xenopodis]|uniref:Uncharacterized protein n=1 Tax=Protopolystoma xenopodis TaxID=117903 RepID=A0A448XJJ1_9PLAT|nr:unnamed protein product [Protopolystoma xenopodis]
MKSRIASNPKTSLEGRLASVILNLPLSSRCSCGSFKRELVTSRLTEPVVRSLNLPLLDARSAADYCSCVAKVMFTFVQLANTIAALTARLMAIWASWVVCAG